MHGDYYFSLPEEVQRGEPSETRETQFRSCNCPGTTLKHQDFVPLLLGPRIRLPCGHSDDPGLRHGGSQGRPSETPRWLPRRFLLGATSPYGSFSARGPRSSSGGLTRPPCFPHDGVQQPVTGRRAFDRGGNLPVVAFQGRLPSALSSPGPLLRRALAQRHGGSFPNGTRAWGLWPGLLLSPDGLAFFGVGS